MPPIQVDTSQFSADQIVFPYKEYSLTTTYRYTSGAIVLPVAPTSSGSVLSTAGTTLDPVNEVGQDGTPPSDFPARGPCVVIQAADPIGFKTIRFKAVRNVIPPVLPDPTPTNTNEVLLSCDYAINAPKLSINGESYEYTAEGTAAYALLRPYWITDGLSGGATPADKSSIASNALPPTFFDNELPGVPDIMAPANQSNDSTFGLVDAF